MEKCAQKEFDRVSIVRDVRLPGLPGVLDLRISMHAGISAGFHSTIIRSAHSTSETKIAGLPNFAPH